MMEEQKRRIEFLMNKLIEDTDRKYIRRLQSDMYKCAANCCQDQQKTIQEVQRCINHCTSPVETAQKFVQEELERSKKRLDRCIDDCGDKLHDKVGPNPSEETVRKYTESYENCVGHCLKNYCDSMPQLEKTLGDIFKRQFPHL